MIVICFQRSADAASDAMLAVMMSCFTPAARAASRTRVVPETAPYKELEVKEKMRTGSELDMTTTHIKDALRACGIGKRRCDMNYGIDT